MANEFLITDVVDKSAFEQLAELEGQFKSLKMQIVDITTTIGSGIKMPTSTIGDMNAKVAEYNTNMQKLAEQQKKYDALLEEYGKLLKKVHDDAKGKVEQEDIGERMARKLEEAQRRLNEALTDEAKELAKVREVTRVQNQENKTAAREALAAAEAVGSQGKSYNELSAEYSKLKQAWNNIRQSERESAAGKEMQQHLIEIRNEMNELQKATGNYSLNVGNYSNSIRDALGLNTGFIGTLTQLAEKGKGAGGAFKAMAAEAKAFGTQLTTLLANPIVATLAAIASVVALVAKGIQSSEENTQKWNVVMAPLNALVQKFGSFIQIAAGYVVDFVTWLGKGLRVFTGWLEAVPLIGGKIKNMNAIIDESVSLQERQNKLDIRRREVTKENAELQLKIAKAEQEAAKVRYTNEKQYIALREQAMEMQKKIAANNEDIAREEAEIMAGQNQWADNTKETNDAIAQAYARAEQAAASYYNSTRKDASAIARTQNTVAKEAAAEAAAAVKERVAMIAEEESSAALALNVIYEGMIQKQYETYQRGEITYEQYQRDMKALNERYAEEQLRLAIETVEAQLDVEGLAYNERVKLEKQLTEKKLALQKQLRDYTAEMTKQARDDEKKRVDAQMEQQERFGKLVDEYYKQIIEEQKQLVDEAMQTLGQLISGIASIISASYDRQMDALDKSLEAETEKYDDMVARGAMTTEEAEARKRVAQEETERKREELAKKQAQVEKAANVASTIMNTAVAIMKAWSQGGIFAAPMVALIAAQGAIQLATILATKAYAKGTDYAAGGLSLVGDGGRSELVLGQRGAWVTPDTPTLVNLHRGDKVLPDAERVFNSRSMMSDYGLLREDGQTDGTPVINIDTMGAEQVKEQSETNERLEDIRRLLRKRSRQQSYQYIYARV